MTTSAKSEEKSESALGRTLSWVLKPFAEVKASEAAGALLLTFTVFLLLTAYYLLKTAREPLILVLHDGARVKSYASVGQSLLLIVVIKVYSEIARRVGRLKLLATIYLFFISNLILFAVLERAKVNIGIVFFLWVGIFNVTAIAQFWSFANDVYTEEQGKRLFAIIGIGSSIGAVAGAKIAEFLVKKSGPQLLMIVAAVILGGCIFLMSIVDRTQGSPGKKKGDPHHEEPLVDKRTFNLLLHDRYLLLIGALTLMLNSVNKTGEYILDRALLESLKPRGLEGQALTAAIGAYKANYFWWVNLVGVGLQLFAVSRIIKYLGVRGALYFLPAVAFLAYGTTAAVPILSVVLMAKVAENATDYSVQSTTNQTLYLVTNRTEKYVGKQVVDTFIVRFGDVFSAGFVWIGSKLNLDVRAFAIINIVLIGIWVVLIFYIGKENKKRSDEGSHGDTPGPDKQSSDKAGDEKHDDKKHDAAGEPAPA